MENHQAASSPRRRRAGTAQTRPTITPGRARRLMVAPRHVPMAVERPRTMIRRERRNMKARRRRVVGTIRGVRRVSVFYHKKRNSYRTYRQKVFVI